MTNTKYRSYDIPHTHALGMCFRVLMTAEALGGGRKHFAFGTDLNRAIYMSLVSGLPTFLQL